MINDWAMGVLKSCLLDLLRKLEDKNFPLILCGGFGLYLKQLELQQRGSDYQPLLHGEFWPRPRTTEDMDILIRTEIFAKADRFRLLRQTLDGLGYQPIVGAEYMQFVRKLPDGGDVKVDLLTGPVVEPLRDKVRIKDRRISPVAQSIGLHARRSDEALGFQDNLLEIRIAGQCTDGHAYESTVFIPPAVTFLMMKLFAFRDRNQDEQKNFARHHAMDLYRIVAMLDHGEFEQTQILIQSFGEKAVLQEAREIVAEFFSSSTALGLLRLQEHNLFKSDTDVQAFSQALTDLLKRS